MVDMNDPEVIESLKYLLVSKEEKIRLAAQPYSPTKNFFVPCKNEGYECAEITEENGDDITLLTRKNEVFNTQIQRISKNFFIYTLNLI